MSRGRNDFVRRMLDFFVQGVTCGSDFTMGRDKGSLSGAWWSLPKIKKLQKKKEMIASEQSNSSNHSQQSNNSQSDAVKTDSAPTRCQISIPKSSWSDVLSHRSPTPSASLFPNTYVHDETRNSSTIVEIQNNSMSVEIRNAPVFPSSLPPLRSKIRRYVVLEL
jgi:hypothetical protein